MELSAKHIALLVQLAEKQRVTYGGVPDGCDDLEHAGYVTTTAVNPAEILTAITDSGRRALAEVKGRQAG
jgi:DNA-binding MarR family transcriptional regulator